MIGYSAYFNLGEGIFKDDINLGLGCMLVSLVINAIYFISEEQIVKEYYIEPLKLIGIEGFIGFVIALFLLILLNFVKCS